MADGQLDLSHLDRVPQAAWDHLASRRIYFGHQSVGYNILDGVQEVLAARPTIRLRVEDSADARALDLPGLVHSKNGSNTDAASKFQAFANLMGAGAGERADLAFYKLCYVDIDQRTNPASAFQAYESGMDRLAADYPRVRFLHVTAPLTSLPRGPKQIIKGWLGSPPWGAEHNARRGEYNRMLLERFGASSTFDLARVESTRPDGRLETFRLRGAEHASLYAGYTDDGGHLGVPGRRAAAVAFLTWLAEVAA